MQFYTCRANEKSGALLYFLTQKITPDQLTIVFVSTRHHVEFIGEVLSLRVPSSSRVVAQIITAKASLMLVVIEFRY